MRNGCRLPIAAPPNSMAPLRGRFNPQIERIVVVLPMPLRPISATTSPSATSRSTPNSAWLAP